MRNYRSMSMNDEKRFCSKCSWNDCDYGCTCPPNEEVYQCDMYMHYHPDEVEEFEKKFDYESLIKEALANIEVKIITPEEKEEDFL